MRLLLLLSLFTLSACVWQPAVYDDETAAGVEAARVSFAAHEELGPFFDEAIAYAVFPAPWRAGTGFGGAFGTGWLFEEGAVIGRAVMVEAFVGVNLGLQTYRKILFFRSEDSLDQFKRGRFEFTGQANMAHVVGGKAATPGYHPDVAMFVEVKGGLLLEASVGTQRYDYLPVPD
ncbi:MAG: hypothetical protein ACR2QB_09655 [Gammaproteobacteria bacterium]